MIFSLKKHLGVRGEWVQGGVHCVIQGPLKPGQASLAPD